MSETQRVNDDLARRQKQWGWNVAFVVALIASLALNLALWQWNQARAERAERTVASLAQQVQTACADDDELLVDGSDVCEHADDAARSVADADPVAGPSGPPGPPGPRGMAGPRGIAGRDGADGRDGRDGQDSTVPGPAGADGAQGPAGDDSTVPGPIGPTGPPGADGADGADGKPGKDGTDGDTGPAGPAGPACAEGYAPTPLYVQSRTDPMMPLTQAWRLATICTPS